jgi:Ca2+-binding EF-hand superfamily protein
MSLSDQQLQGYIEQVFGNFDRDRTGSLNTQELAQFFNEVFRSAGINRQISQQEAMAAMQGIDRNRDGQANKQ